MDDGFAGRLAALMAERGLGVLAVARRVPCDMALVSRLASGRQLPSLQTARRLDEVLGAGGEIAALAAAVRAAARTGTAIVPSPHGDEIAAVELARRAAASDAGAATITQLENALDGLATAYPASRPAELLARVRAHLGYVTALLDGRMTLSEHRRLLINGAWLSLLAATCLIDLNRPDPAAAYLRTAAALASETGHGETAAWVLETRAWHAVTNGDYRRAVSLAQDAQRVAPKGGSAYIQATAQEGRAWARLGASPESRDALARTEAMASGLAEPDRPEHHYRYDPAKARAYLATTLSWLGDPAAAGFARAVLARLEPGGDGAGRPRRAASARLDLALALTVTGQPEESAGNALTAVTSGLLVPSNYWRADEVISALAAAGLPETAQLREAYQEHCRPVPAGKLPLTGSGLAGR
jgi:transcriptional regulator with XRE-family HTH domain